MFKEVQIKLQEELDKYLSGKGEFIPYYPGMNVYSSELYKKQLEEASQIVENQGEIDVNSFKLYLDTIIINMHTKAKKYKQSIYFSNEDIKDIDNQGFTIPFYVDAEKKRYILLGIVPSKVVA